MLEEDEELLVGVQLAGSDEGTLCWQICTERTSPPDAHQSASDGPPFRWEPAVVEGALNIALEGEASP